VRSFRKVVGLVLVLIGFLALLAGGAGLLALRHRDAHGAFTTQLAPLHADGYAVEVPDANTTLGDIGPTGLLGTGVLGTGRLQVTLRSTNASVLLGLAPSAQVGRYLAGVPRDQLVAVGFATGDAPVTEVPAAGIKVPAAPGQQSFWLATGAATVSWQPSSTPLSLVVIRTDGQPGLDVTLAVSRDAGWLQRWAIGLLVAGLAGLIGGVALLFVTAEPVLVVEAHRMVAFADRIADGLERIPPGESLAVIRRTRGLDLTGELITVPSDEPPQRWFGWGHTPPELADKWAPDDGEEPDSGSAGSDGESPYVYTAT
jgi:hypothetical protein